MADIANLNSMEEMVSTFSDPKTESSPVLCLKITPPPRKPQITAIQHIYKLLRKSLLSFPLVRVHISGCLSVHYHFNYNYSIEVQIAVIVIELMKYK